MDSYEADFARLAKWFNKSEKQADPNQWYERVRDIPDEAWPTIVNHFIDTSKFFPTPQEVRNSFQEWLQSRPEKQSIRHETWCDDCGSSGALRVQIEETRGTRDTLFRCGACENWSGSLGNWIPRRRRSDLVFRKGYTVLTVEVGDPDDAGVYVAQPPEGLPARARRASEPSHIREVVPQIAEQDIPF